MNVKAATKLGQILVIGENLIPHLILSDVLIHKYALDGVSQIGIQWELVERVKLECYALNVFLDIH